MSTLPPSNDFSALNFDDMGLCVKNCDQTVIFQNELCTSICGHHMHQECRECVSDEEKPSSASRIQQIHSHLCDLYRFSEDKNRSLTVFYVADKKFGYFRQLFLEKRLTPQETEIGFLLLQRFKNADIAKTLFISLATLKTHINHIYQKCPELKSVR